MNKGTINRTNGNTTGVQPQGLQEPANRPRNIFRKKIFTRGKGVDLMQDIFKLISNSERPLSTQDIAKGLNKPWHSVQTRCLMLQVESKVICFRIGRMNLWQISSPKK